MEASLPGCLLSVVSHLEEVNTSNPGEAIFITDEFYGI